MTRLQELEELRDLLIDKAAAKLAEINQEIEQEENRTTYRVEDYEFNTTNAQMSFALRQAIVNARARGEKYQKIADKLQVNIETVKTVLSRYGYQGSIRNHEVPELEVDTTILKRMPENPMEVRAINLYYTKTPNDQWYSYQDIINILLRENYYVPVSWKAFKNILHSMYNEGGRQSL